MKRVFIFFVAILLCFCRVNAQENEAIQKIIIDSDSIISAYDQVLYINGMAGKMRYAPETIELFNLSKKLAVNSNNINAKADFFYGIGNYHYFNNSLDSCLYYMTKVIQLNVKLEDPFIKAGAHSTMAGVYRKQGNATLTISSYLNSQALIDAVDTIKLTDKNKMRYKGKLMELFNGMANFYNDNEEPEKALNYYKKATQKALELDEPIYAGIIIGNRGDVLLKVNRNEEALKNFVEGKELKEKGNAPARLIANSNLNIGSAYRALHNFTESLKYYNLATSYYLDNNLEDKLAEAESGIGLLHLNEKLYDSAVTNCEAAKQKAQASAYKQIIVQSCDCLYKAYKETGQFEKALENFELYNKEQNSIFNEKNIKKQTQLEMLYEFDKTRAIKDLELDAQEKQSKLYFIIAIALGFFALFLGYFSTNVIKQTGFYLHKKSLLEKTIDQKNILLKETHHRVKNSFQMVSSLLYIQGETTQQVEAQIAIKEAQNRVRSMVLTHQKLYNTEDLVGIDTKEYITDLTKDVVDSYNLQNNIKYQVTVEKHILNIDTITPLGIILNELLTNCFKHAFNDTMENPLIMVGFKKENDDYILEVSDNGTGISSDRRDGALGLELLESLAIKLNGTFNIQALEKKGTKAMVKFESYELN